MAGDFLNVMDFGAKGDGVINDAPAIQSTISCYAKLTTESNHRQRELTRKATSSGTPHRLPATSSDLSV